MSASSIPWVSSQVKRKLRNWWGLMLRSNRPVGSNGAGSGAWPARSDSSAATGVSDDASMSWYVMFYLGSEESTV